MQYDKITRRSFIVGAAVAGASLAGAGALAGCKSTSNNSTDSNSGNNDSTAGGTKSGGIVSYFLTEPACIDPYNLKETQGTQVTSNLFDSLFKYDYAKEKLVPAAAADYEVSPDATIFTFYLTKGVKFHNGDPVTAADFKRAWERLCNPKIAGTPSQISHHLAQVQGYKEMFIDKTATELTGVKALDDLTLEVTLTAPYADFIYVVTHPALGPVPKAAEDFANFTEAPIGNGPFKMDGSWKHNQYIQVKRFDDYYGEKALVDGVDFKIYATVDSGFTDFQAGNLDWSQIPRGQITQTAQQYGESDDGYTVNPGKQTLLGPQSSVYYLLINNNDPVLSNQKLREAISYAVNRSAITDVLLQGAYTPADGLIPPGINGYRSGAWRTAIYDVVKAKQALAGAGYPNGEGLAPLTLSYNADGDQEQIMALIQSDLNAIGIQCGLNGMQWADYLDALAAGSIQIGSLSQVADYPLMENFLFSLFYTKNASNYSKYSNPAVDQGIMDARGNLDDTKRIAAFQAVDDIIQSTTPIIPVMFYKHTYVGSNRLNNFYFSPAMIPDLKHAWLSK